MCATEFPAFIKTFFRLFHTAFSIHTFLKSIDDKYLPEARLARQSFRTKTVGSKKYWNSSSGLWCLQTNQLIVFINVHVYKTRARDEEQMEPFRLVWKKESVADGLGFVGSFPSWTKAMSCIKMILSREDGDKSADCHHFQRTDTLSFRRILADGKGTATASCLCSTQRVIYIRNHFDACRHRSSLESNWRNCSKTWGRWDDIHC